MRQGVKRAFYEIDWIKSKKARGQKLWLFWEFIVRKGLFYDSVTVTAVIWSPWRMLLTTSMPLVTLPNTV